MSSAVCDDYEEPITKYIASNMEKALENPCAIIIFECIKKHIAYVPQHMYLCNATEPTLCEIDVQCTCGCEHECSPTTGCNCDCSCLPTHIISVI